ncbi:MAG TPA: NAD-dependent epimerase/dehydratase family protein [Thermoanaerobaculales bacterium]|nr:NAD-dependent epimerase/dehydratase family protein [Thermoanaerobaculales bacterium]HPA79338.1 NAD-dependent epimerase/dehydratase family protein [Thermoanaerobaculales bacterium]HQL30208.1 NAD-dependent epimerase/dehydratase family protein [Thermoanaerobaculales bacterium]HQN96177.1 NAD-dependent epimerase/dehydratase family protein [Thermoanaerobaculales bacterium]
MKALVTGGGGFLGGAVVRGLRERGWQVRSFQRRRSETLAGLGVEQRLGDLVDPHAVRAAVEGCEVVFHVAARAVLWGPRREFESANVAGTRNVLAACRQAGVRRLVHTSTPAVVHAGRHLEGVDESAPYATRFESHYPRTKAAAERMVLAANGPDLATVALRPHLIWGPGDTQLVGRIVARARAGRLWLVGDGANLVDTTFVDNAAAAHLLACERLQPGARCAGNAYFITNGEPRPIAEVLARILAASGEPPLRRRLPYPLAWAAAAVVEAGYRALAPRAEPPLTRMLVRHLATAHWYDITAARRDLGYSPAVSLDEGFRRLGDWYQEGAPA